MPVRSVTYEPTGRWPRAFEEVLLKAGLPLVRVNPLHARVLAQMPELGRARHPARATDQGTVDNFRRDCLRELKKIKGLWPDLHYRTVKGALLLSPSPPVIAPSQLRLVDKFRQSR